MGSTENVVDILVRRDRISKRDAVARVKECKRRLYEEAIPWAITKRQRISWQMNSD